MADIVVRANKLAPLVIDKPNRFGQMPIAHRSYKESEYVDRGGPIYALDELN